MPTEQCNRVLVERYFLGESGTEEKRSVRLHLDGCPGCRGHMATLENRKREYLIAHPFREFAAKHLPEGRDARRPSMSTRWMPALAGLAACLALVPVVIHYNQTASAVSEDGIRAKGGTVMEYYVKRGETVTPGSSKEPYRSGDELQFVYAAGSHAYVTLASVDSRGHVSLYKAEGADAPLSLAAKAGEKQSMPFAVTLDDSPGSELFVMIYGPEPLAGGAVESWLMEAFTRASGNLEGLTSVLPPPPGSTASAPAGTDRAAKPEFKSLLLRKTQA
ncbi:MAG: hypothetical protein JWP91_3669 [Fibrobacteres bacterium]|nr:hypothetical protein [Fibrobacterota bacterium]